MQTYGDPIATARFSEQGEIRDLSISWHERSGSEFQSLLLQGSDGLDPAVSLFEKADTIEPPLYFLPDSLIGTWEVDSAASIATFMKFGIAPKSGLAFAMELEEAGWGFEIKDTVVVGRMLDVRSAPISKQSVVVPWTNDAVAFVLLDIGEPSLPLAIVQRDEWSCDALIKWRGQDVWVRMSRVK